MSTYDNAPFNISWPSLYPPSREVGFLGPPVRPDGYYLSGLDDIFQFTLYWTLIFHLPFSFIAGTYALFNISFPPAKSVGATIALVSPVVHTHEHTHSRSHSYTQSQPPPPSELHADTTIDAWPAPPRTNARRSRLTFAFLVLFTFLGTSLLRAVVSAAVIACVLYGVYRAGGFYMSTWIPFLWAAIGSLVALLEIWPSIIDLI